MDLVKIKPLPGWVFLEANIPVSTSSGIILPAEYEERYPQSGIVLATGRLKEDVQVGDLCVIPDEGTFHGRTYYQVCYLVLKDWPERVLCSSEIEPVIRETVYDFHSGGRDKKILIEPIEGDKIHFDTSDILDYGLEDIANPMVKIEYVPVVMMHFWEGGLERLYYFAREEEILVTIKGW